MSDYEKTRSDPPEGSAKRGMRLEFMLLADHIRELSRGKPVLYISNPGNWGDGLIRAGTLSFFCNMGIAYKDCSLGDRGKIARNLQLGCSRVTQSLVVIGGGGSWSQNFRHMESIVTTLQKRFHFRNILVLPSTYDRHYEIPGVSFWRRDQYQSRDHMPESRFCHDMAFFLEPISARPPTKQLGNMFRTDCESAGVLEIPPDNYDVSLEGTEKDPVGRFIEIVSEYEEIHTDRLHVSIAASMVGRRVELYEGSYFKNGAVFHSSISGVYPNTHYMGSASSVGENTETAGEDGNYLPTREGSGHLSEEAKADETNP